MPFLRTTHVEAAVERARAAMATIATEARDLAGALADLHENHGLTYDQICEEVGGGLVKGTVSKLLSWRAAGFPLGGPFVLARHKTEAIEHHADAEDAEAAEDAESFSQETSEADEAVDAVTAGTVVSFTKIARAFINVVGLAKARETFEAVYDAASKKSAAPKSKKLPKIKTPGKNGSEVNVADLSHHARKQLIEKISQGEIPVEQRRAEMVELADQEGGEAA